MLWWKSSAMVTCEAGKAEPILFDESNNNADVDVDIVTASPRQKQLNCAAGVEYLRCQ